MTTEYIMLMAFFALVLAGAVFGETGPIATFSTSAPRLAARIERNLATGTDWRAAQGKDVGGWRTPQGAPPRTN